MTPLIPLIIGCVNGPHAGNIVQAWANTKFLFVFDISPQLVIYRRIGSSASFEAVWPERYVGR